MWSIHNKKGDSKKCWWFGHKLRVLKDDKTVWCDRCDRRIALYKTGYAKIGMDCIREKESKLMWDIPKLTFLIIAFIYMISLWVGLFK